MKRNGKGQFIVTTGSTKRKTVQYHGNRMSFYEKEFCILLGIDKLPRELMVHHIDRNTLNDDINNLALMTYTAHNRLHAPEREIWNKGLTTKTNEKWRKTVELAVRHKTKRMFRLFEEAYLLKQDGYRVKDIAKRQGICDRQVYERIKRYHKLKEKYGN
jgi:predicted ATP-binding protein involved in virulence